MRARVRGPQKAAPVAQESHGAERLPQGLPSGGGWCGRVTGCQSPHAVLEVVCGCPTSRALTSCISAQDRSCSPHLLGQCSLWIQVLRLSYWKMLLVAFVYLLVPRGVQEQVTLEPPEPVPGQSNRLCFLCRSGPTSRLFASTLTASTSWPSWRNTTWRMALTWGPSVAPLMVSSEAVSPRALIPTELTAHWWIQPATRNAPV